ncbi:MAG: 2-polyprenylphenol 6-hydroxylase [Pseudomonadota bacterium]|nr:2-polyprenylphenol 6-hydroxylase [Pseudomonadota bacterium]
MLSFLHHIRRLIFVIRTLSQHDSLFPLNKIGMPRCFNPFIRICFVAIPNKEIRQKREGERLTLALTALGPAFIKLGQALSVRPDLIGERMAGDLSKLQDNLPPFNGRDAKYAIQKEFGQSVEELFRAFNENAIAAASIAQVHRATTNQGMEVAVKILRPNIEKAFAMDLELALWLAGQIERYRPETRRLRPLRAIETIIRSVEIEMDLRFEGAAADELRANLHEESWFNVPVVDWSRTGRRVLTTAWIEGKSINEIRTKDVSGRNPSMILATLAKVFFLQVFRDGFFHADLHPGNIIIDVKGEIHVVDFGIMGRLDRQTRQYLAEMLYGFLSADYKLVADVHIRAGYVPKDQSAEEFAQAARSIAEPILGLPLGEISLARLLGQLFTITEKFKMQAQPQLFLLQKTMLVAEGVGRKLHPEVNLWELAKPMIREWMEHNMGPEARIRATTENLLDGFAQLPVLISCMEETVTERKMFSGGHQFDSIVREKRQFRRLWFAVIALTIVVISFI